jgi:uncharacterized protein YecT (DUF1311 family)
MKCLALLFLTMTGFAQQSKQFQACGDRAKTQMEINACAGDEATRTDAELNAVYRKLLAAAGSDTDAVEKIRAAEKAWLIYRDAYLEAMYPAKDKQAEYGSIYPMDVALLTAKLNGRQTQALKELLSQYKD